MIVIIREDLITEDVLPGTPTMLQYKIHADAGSLYNTPPAYGIYICGKVFKWLKGLGGLSAIQKVNEEKAKSFCTTSWMKAACSRARCADRTVP